MPVPDNEWKPWIGPQFAKSWEAALKELTFDIPIDYCELVPIMMKAGDLERKSVINVLQRARVQKVLKVVSIYDFRTKTGPTVVLNESSIGSEDYEAWMERPAAKTVDRWKRQKRIDKKVLKNDPIGQRYEGDGERFFPKPADTTPVLDIQEYPGEVFTGEYHFKTGQPVYKDIETGAIVLHAVVKQKKKKGGK